MTDLEGQSAEHLQSQQQFISNALKEAQEAKDELTSKLQGHLTKNFAFITEEEAALAKLLTITENCAGIHKRLVIRMHQKFIFKNTF